MANEWDSRGRMAGPGDMRQAMGRLATLFTGAMPPGVPQDYLAVPTGPLLSGTAVPMPMTQFQARASGLLVPAELARTPTPFDEVGFFLTGSEILGVSREEFAARFPPDCIETLVSTSSLEAIALFAAISLWHLHRFGVDAREADGELASQYLPPPFADKVRALLREDPNRRFLAPQVLLILLKIACQVGTDDPLAALPTGMPKISAMLALAEYLSVNEPETPSKQNAAIGRPGRLGRAVISTQIFHANPDEAYLMGRFYRRWLGSPTVDPTDDQVCDLPALFEQATGVPLGDWITVGLGLFSLLQDQQQPRIGPIEYAQRIGWPAARLEAVLQLVCVDTATLRDLAVRETAQTGRDWAFGTFERYPLLRLRDGSVLILDPHLLVRRFFSWLPLFDLTTAPGMDKKVANRAEGYMRTLSERYALDALASAVADQATKRLYDGTEIKSAFAKRKSSPRTADAAIDYGDAWLVVEVTTSTLTRASTAGVSDQDVVKDIDKLVEKVEQLDSTIQCLRQAEERLTGAPGALNRRFYPLLVVAEGFPVSPFTLPLLREKAGERGYLTGPDVAQLEVVDLVELEMLEALSENDGPGIVEVLAAKRHGSLANTSIRDFILLELKRQPGRPKRLDVLWMSIFDVVADTLGMERRRFEGDGDSAALERARIGAE